MEWGSRRKAAVHPTERNISNKREYSSPTHESDAESGYSSQSSWSDRSKDFNMELRSDRPSGVERLSEESDSSIFMSHKDDSSNLPDDRTGRVDPQGSDCSSSGYSDASFRSNRSKDADCDFNSHPPFAPESFRNMYEKLIQREQEVIRQMEVIRQREDLVRQREDLICQKDTIRHREDLLREREDLLRQREDLLSQREDSLRQQAVQQKNQEVQRKIRLSEESDSSVSELSNLFKSNRFMRNKGNSWNLPDDRTGRVIEGRPGPPGTSFAARLYSPERTESSLPTVEGNKDRSSVVILGKGTSLKEAVITNFLEKDLSSLPKREINATTVYETKELEFICTPDFKTSYSEIKALFSDKQFYDMHLVVVERRLPPEDTWALIEELSKTTGVETENLFVVLPSYQKEVPESHYPFKFYTFDQLQSKLSELEKKSTASSSLPTVEGNKGRHPDTKVNLVLLGMTGTGKSACGNTIIGKKVFESKISSIPVTKECQKEEAQINFLNVRVIDTPDMFDDEMAKSAKGKHVKKCKELCESDPCVFVLVMHVSRFTDGERDILKKLEKMFGENVSKQTVILFTRGNDLRQAEVNFRDFLHDCQVKLKEIVAKCDNRCVLFENSKSDPDQVDKLMNMVDLVLKKKKLSQRQ